MTDYTKSSLAALKQMAAATKPAMLHQSVTAYDKGGQAVSTAMDEFMAHVSSLGDSWQGSAAQAAVADAKRTQQTMDQTNSTATSSSSMTQSYSSSMQQQQSQVESIPNVDTSFGHAVTTGGMAGPIGVIAAKAKADRQYNENQGQAATIVKQMDSDGQTHAAQMRSTSWPQGAMTGGTPPATLPPVPGSSARGGSGGGLGYGGTGTGAHGSGTTYSAVAMGPATSKDFHDVVNGPKGKNPGSGATSVGGKGTKSPTLPTVPSGGTGPVTSQGASGGGTPSGDIPGVNGAEGGAGAGAGGAGGAGAAAGVLGGAGLLGAGALTGRGGGVGLGRGGALAEGEGAGLRGGAAGEGEGSGLRGGRAGSGLAEGEGSGLRGGRAGSGLAEGEGSGLRGGARGLGGGAADDELGQARRGTLRTGVPEGFGGEPVSAEAGRAGYPMGGSGGRRRDDDEEAPVPDYLVETEDIWGSGKSAAPPVIGE